MICLHGSPPLVLLRCTFETPYSLGTYIVEVYFGGVSRADLKNATPTAWLDLSCVILILYVLIAYVQLSKNFQRKIATIFLPSNLNICYCCSTEPYHWDCSFEYPQHMFWLRNKKIGTHIYLGACNRFFFLFFFFFFFFFFTINMTCSIV